MPDPDTMQIDEFQAVVSALTEMQTANSCLGNARRAYERAERRLEGLEGPEAARILENVQRRLKAVEALQPRLFTVPKCASARDERRLIEGAEVLALPQLGPDELEADKLARLTLLLEAIGAMQSLDDLREETNARVLADINTLIERYDQAFSEVQADRARSV